MTPPAALAQSARPGGRTGQEKVAILLLALGNPLGTKLLQVFSPDEVKVIMESAESIGTVEREDLEHLIDEFSGQFAKTLGLSTDTNQFRSLIESAFPPDQINKMLGNGETSDQAPVWPRFTAGSENTLVPYLLDEHPQTIAFILANLGAELAATCLAMLPREVRDSVAKRLLKMMEVKPAVSQIVESCLLEDLLAKTDTGLEKAGRARVADIMNRLDRDQQSLILDSLKASRPEDAQALRSMVFAFEDISLLDQPSRLTLFDKVATEQVIPALRGMPPEFKELVLSSMGARARRMVESELANDNGQLTPAVKAARRAIADLAIAMAGRGDIGLPSIDENEVAGQ